MEVAKYTKEEIVKMLTSSNLAIERGLVAIFRKQTRDEQYSEETKHLNRVGFSGAHAKTGTYLANYVLSGKHLSGKWVEKGRRMILHYAQQLTDIANANN